MEPVQSGFTVYVPSMVTFMMLPFAFIVAVAVVCPFPSKVCPPISSKGPGYTNLDEGFFLLVLRRQMDGGERAFR
jgi:hypothetical protein